MIIWKMFDVFVDFLTKFSHSPSELGHRFYKKAVNLGLL
jgi:hypothetical protein